MTMVIVVPFVEYGDNMDRELYRDEHFIITLHQTGYYGTGKGYITLKASTPNVNEELFRVNFDKELQSPRDMENSPRNVEYPLEEAIDKIYKNMKELNEVYDKADRLIRVRNA